MSSENQYSFTSFFLNFMSYFGIFPGGSEGEESTHNAGNPGSIPGLGRSAGEGLGYPLQYSWAPCGSAGKESTCNAGDLGSIPGLRRSPGEGKGYPLQYSGMETSMDCRVHGVTKSRTRLSNFHLNISLEMTRRTDSVQFSRSVVSDSAVPWPVFHEAPLSMGFPR